VADVRGTKAAMLLKPGLLTLLNHLLLVNDTTWAVDPKSNEDEADNDNAYCGAQHKIYILHLKFSVSSSNTNF
jgi:hypothetical protein